ncbi:VOC family protein [Roseibium sp. RKSG952]|uniref:VOC family protein n=1 Tax=Roseibium sp. RKSG952 TaxID=2529384 RepID=UPI0012BD559E|nr:VOC family protein [Roseibium sp. RKSG952]MTH99688.1 VOC family protein [Roseibium sp. RKSG952]
MPESRLEDFVIDCPGDDLDKHAAFWAETLGRTLETTVKNPRYRRLTGKPGEIGILLQAVDHAPRIHLDLVSGNVPAEVDRLEGLGARVHETFENWVVMEAPSGHRFCIVNSKAGGCSGNSNES